MWLFSPRKKKVNLADELESIYREIHELETRISEREAARREALSALFYYPAAAEAVAAAWCWMHWAARTLTARAAHAAPLVAVPLLAYLARQLYLWAYRRAKAADERQLSDMRKSVQEKVDELKKETDFERTQKLICRASGDFPSVGQPQAPSSQVAPLVPASGAPNASPSVAPISPPTQQLAQPGQGLPQQQQQHMLLLQQQRAAAAAAAAAAGPPRRTWMDRLVDAVLGDGRGSDSYALICSACGWHNGFIPASEYATAKFACRACRYINGRGPQVPPAATGRAPQQIRAPETQAAAAEAPAPATAERTSQS